MVAESKLDMDPIPMQGYSKRQHGGHSSSTTRTATVKSEITILQRHNQNRAEVWDSAMAYARSKQVSWLCFKINNTPMPTTPGTKLKPIFVKMEGSGTTSKTTPLEGKELVDAEAKVEAADAAATTLSPMERKIAQSNIIYADPQTGLAEDAEKAKMRWMFFKALQAATPYHRHKVYAPGDVHGLLDAVFGEEHYGLLAPFDNLKKLFTGLHYDRHRGVDSILDPCKRVIEKAKEMDLKETVHARIVVSAVLSCLLEQGGSEWQPCVSSIQADYQETKTCLEFEKLVTKLREHEQNLAVVALRKEKPEGSEQHSSSKSYNPKAMLTCTEDQAPPTRKKKPWNKKKKGDKKTRPPVECFNCGGPHFVRDCPERKNTEQASFAATRFGELQAIQALHRPGNHHAHAVIVHNAPGPSRRMAMSPGQPHTSSEKELTGEGSPKAQGVFIAQGAATDELPVKVDGVLSCDENTVAKFKQVLETVAHTRAHYVDKAHARQPDPDSTLDTSPSSSEKKSQTQVACPKSLKSKSAGADTSAGSDLGGSPSARKKFLMSVAKDGSTEQSAKISVPYCESSPAEILTVDTEEPNFHSKSVSPEGLKRRLATELGGAPGAKEQQHCHRDKDRARRTYACCAGNVRC